ncbi:hypothetical protein Tco_1033437 [Tanacetum coccineum]
MDLITSHLDANKLNALHLKCLSWEKGCISEGYGRRVERAGESTKILRESELRWKEGGRILSLESNKLLCMHPRKCLVLNALIGHGNSLFRRSKLKALGSIHGQEVGKGGELYHDETAIINGTLDLTAKTAEEAMTPIESAFSLDVNSKLEW